MKDDKNAFLEALDVSVRKKEKALLNCPVHAAVVPKGKAFFVRKLRD